MAQRAATVIALALISSCSAVEDFGDEDDGAPAERSPAQREKYTFTLEHDVTGTGGSFTSRNEVSYEGSIGLPAAGSKRRPTIRVSKFSFSADELDSIDKLARSGGVYRIRAPTSVKGDSEGYVMSYVPAVSAPPPAALSPRLPRPQLTVAPCPSVRWSPRATRSTWCSISAATGPRPRAPAAAAEAPPRRLTSRSGRVLQEHPWGRSGHAQQPVLDHRPAAGNRTQLAHPRSSRRCRTPLLTPAAVAAQSKKKVNVVSTVRVDLGMDAEKPTMPEKFEEMLKDNSGGGGGSKKRKEEEDPGIFRKYVRRPLLCQLPAPTDVAQCLSYCPLARSGTSGRFFSSCGF